jgi:hypothetical protein
LLAAVYAFSVDISASRGAAITGDEPFYLLTTQSLLDDGDFDLRNQYEQRSYESFFDHPDGLWQQSVPNDKGKLLSPHNPGLSVFLLPGFAIAGLAGAQVQLLLAASLAFALTFAVVASVTGKALVSWASTLAVAVSATPFIYSSEIYPELPAALVVVVSLGLWLRWREGPWAGIAMAVVLSLLPWLGIKYAPLAAIVAVAFVLRSDRPARLALVLVAIPSAAAYALAHYAMFGALTPYSVGTVHAGQSTADVLGSHLDIREQAYRLYGIFIDRRFGIGRWAPILLVALAGVPLLLRRPAGVVAAALILAQLLMATFVAITMMGWWFPGRTMVTVIPLLALPLALLIDRFGRPAMIAASVAAAYSFAVTVVLAQAGHSREIVIAVDPFELSSPVFAALSPLFPQYTSWTTETRLLTAAWLGVAGVGLAALYRPALEAGLRQAKAVGKGMASARRERA